MIHLYNFNLVQLLGTVIKQFLHCMVSQNYSFLNASTAMNHLLANSKSENSELNKKGNFIDLLLLLTMFLMSMFRLLLRAELNQQMMTDVNTW